MKSLWFELEIINAMKLSENRPHFSNKELNELANIVEKMRVLILNQENNIPDDYWNQKSWYK